jgi:hypothetical protein
MTTGTQNFLQSIINRMIGYAAKPFDRLQSFSHGLDDVPPANR